ncbi:serine/threonine protein kinase [Scheffersomyces xylosifermentans]|uniref:serine/threonine protein kinase n=1 Tax=Scheffersomyces xylosifermentans TaxID=1304137 RepID=UPI00315DB14D
MPVPPPNAYQPGTKLTVGSHSITIIKYISEGGFAHVYTCNIEPAFRGSNLACLKRVAVPSKWQLSLLRMEVDSMRRLRGNKHIVSYIDSHASRMGSSVNGSANSKEQQYEVFLLMEYCENNGLIDYMNTRLVNKLTEKEIIDIMYQVTIGVAMCHNLRPPLIHRDIKIENVLIDRDGVYKLCDFGSAVPYIPAPKTAAEISTIREDIMQHTTPQYRAPEMIDLTKGFPIDDKSDIWALGCFLYKLCYYTTPFESPNHGSLQEMEQSILNCSQTLRFRDAPGSMFSHRMKNIIKCCLRPDPRRRPNAIQLLGEIVSMRGDTVVPDVIPYSVKEHMRISFSNSANSSNSSSEEGPIISSIPVRAKKDDELLVKPVSVKVQSAFNMSSSKSPDPFASIDKSKLLSSSSGRGGPIPRPKSTYIPPHTTDMGYSGSNNRPLSVFADENVYKHANKSTSAIKDYIQSQLSGNESVTVGRRSFESNKSDTLEFLRSKEETSRNDTGGSIKAAFGHFRKISTGNNSYNGTQSPNNTGGNGNKLSKRQSIKKILTGGNGNRRVSAETQEDYLRVPEDKQPKKLSIQKRVQMLNKSKESVQKTASGYGKYTDSKASEDIEAINAELSSTSSRSSVEEITIPKRTHKSANSNHSSIKMTSGNSHSSHSSRKHGPPKVPFSLSSHAPKSEKHLPAVVVTKHALKKSSKGPPPKPKKPTYLKSSDPKPERRLSNSSDISLPDVDDLEESFSKRFPSYV